MLTAHQVLRGLGIVRWASWVVIAIIFVALFSRAIGGLEPITSALDAVGVDIGRRRLSLLGLVTVLVIVVTLLAVARLANRFEGGQSACVGDLWCLKDLGILQSICARLGELRRHRPHGSGGR